MLACGVEPNRDVVGLAVPKGVPADDGCGVVAPNGEGAVVAEEAAFTPPNRPPPVLGVVDAAFPNRGFGVDDPNSAG